MTRHQPGEPVPNTNEGDVVVKDIENEISELEIEGGDKTGSDCAAGGETDLGVELVKRPVME